MESKCWIVIERLLSLATIVILALTVWNTLIRIETKQANDSKRFNETLEAIRKQMDNDELWQNANESIRSNSR